MTENLEECVALHGDDIRRGLGKGEISVIHQQPLEGRDYTIIFLGDKLIALVTGHIYMEDLKRILLLKMLES